MTTDFQRGARAMFDCLMERAANNFHANPVIKEACEKENVIIEKWAADALETVDPSSFREWKSIEAAYQLGRKSALKEKRHG